VTVTGVTLTTATVQIIKPVEAPVTDPIFLVAPTSTYDDSYRVETPGRLSRAVPMSRSSRPTSGSAAARRRRSPQRFLARRAELHHDQLDLGMYIRVVLKHNGTIVIGDPITQDRATADRHRKYLVDQPGTVSINNSATPLVATPASWPSGTTYAYQWYRGSTASTATTAISGSGANTAFYTPTSADYGKFLR
jgi:hypothetical protein